MIANKTDNRTINESNSSVDGEARLKGTRSKIQSLGRGGIAKVSKDSGVNKTKVSRFVSGSEISASSYVAIEKTVNELTQCMQTVQGVTQ